MDCMGVLKTEVNADGRVCTRCDTWKAWELFNRHSTGFNGRKPHCRDCDKKWWKFYRYGLTSEDFDELYETQSGQCKLCSRDIQKTQSSKADRKAAVVDHDHKTGKIRGLLCHPCNVAIGLLNEDPSLLLRAAEYVT